MKFTEEFFMCTVKFFFFFCHRIFAKSLNIVCPNEPESKRQFIVNKYTDSLVSLLQWSVKKELN